MAILWTPDLAIGVEAIDRQHQDLFAAIDRLLVAMSDGRGRGEVAQLLGFLGQYAVEHFRDEEQLMSQSRYPDLAQHRRVHEEFKADFGRLSAQLEAGGPTSSLVLEVNRRAAQWLRTHVMGMDKKLGAFLQEGAHPAR
jgi:hemerythrin